MQLFFIVIILFNDTIIDIMDFLLYFLARYFILILIIFTILYFSIIIHEGGHLIFGLMSGYKFLSFRIAFLVWYKENDKIKFSFSQSALAGQCLLAPPDYIENFKYTLYNLGGGFMNLIFAGVFLIPSIIFLKNETLFLIFITTFFANLAFAFLNLYPLISSGIPNDGMNQKMAKKSKLAEYSFYLILYINYKLSQGNRFKDFDEDMFKVDGLVNQSNYLECYILICKAEWLFDSGKIAESEKILEDINLDNLPLFYQAQILSSRIINNFLYLNDFEKAKQLFNNKKYNKFLKLKLPTNYLVKSIYEFYAKNNSKNAEKFLIQEKKIVNSYPNKGHKIMMMETIDDFEKQM